MIAAASEVRDPAAECGRGTTQEGAQAHRRPGLRCPDPGGLPAGHRAVRAGGAHRLRGQAAGGSGPGIPPRPGPPGNRPLRGLPGSHPGPGSPDPPGPGSPGSRPGPGSPGSPAWAAWVAARGRCPWPSGPRRSVSIIRGRSVIGSRKLPVQVPPCQMLSTATPVSAYQLIRRLRAVLLTSKKTSPRRGSGAAPDVDMEPMVTLTNRICLANDHLACNGVNASQHGLRSPPARVRTPVA